MIGKIVMWLVIIMLAVYAVTNPSVAGRQVHGILTSIFAFAQGFAGK